jgi:hypothetical protein
VCDSTKNCTGTSPDCPSSFLAAGTVCEAADLPACLGAAVCTGSSAACPARGPAANGSICEACCVGSRTCEDGACTGGLCCVTESCCTE